MTKELTKREADLMNIIIGNPGCYSRSIAEAIRKNPALPNSIANSVYRTVGNLVLQGYVKQTSDRQEPGLRGQPKKRLKVTKEGKEKLIEYWTFCGLMMSLHVDDSILEHNRANISLAA